MAQVLGLIELQKEHIQESAGLAVLDRLFTSAMLWAVRDKAIDTHPICKLDTKEGSIELSATVQIVP